MATFLSASSKPGKRWLMLMPGGGSIPMRSPGGNTGSAAAMLAQIVNNRRNGNRNIRSLSGRASPRLCLGLTGAAGRGNAKKIVEGINLWLGQLGHPAASAAVAPDFVNVPLAAPDGPPI